MPHLPSAIPEVKHQVAQEFDTAMLDVDGSSEATDILCDVVAEDD